MIELTHFKVGNTVEFGNECRILILKTSVVNNEESVRFKCLAPTYLRGKEDTATLDVLRTYANSNNVVSWG